MKQINSNNEEEIQTAVTGQIEKISSITDKNDIKENRANSVEKILFMYATAVSDVGTVRSNNQDSAFAGEHLAAICDGMGGHAGGDTASTIAIRSLAHIEQDSRPHDVKTVSSMMETSIMAAHDAIVGKAKRERRLAGMGTTVTAVTLVRGYWVLAHLGDSRAYLLRDNHLMRMTTDHSYVQHLIDTGHITPEEARNHPQRNVVMRVLGDFDIDPRPDIALRSAHPSDRWLLCSDGLCGVLEDSTIQDVMSSISNQEECAQKLVSMALRAGSTDNVTAVIADATLALDADAFDLPHQTPLIGGAASKDLESIADIVNKAVASAPALREDKNSPAQRAAALAQDDDNSKNPDEGTISITRIVQPSHIREEVGELHTPDTNEIPIVKKKNGKVSTDPHDPDVARAVKHEQDEAHRAHSLRRRWTRIGISLGILLVLFVISGVGYGVYAWTQTQYYIGKDSNKVVIYQGVPTNIFGIALSHKVESTDIPVNKLDKSWQDQLKEGISFGSLVEARGHASLIRREMRAREQEKLNEQNQKKLENKINKNKDNAKQGGKTS
ncbi:phosphoprotein phosphatase [Gardnerella sp. DNF01162]|jgi:protein phosphatase 2C|uniref:Phosphoprotein phosphatase n=2 Tax=Gardnerella TaxID=2701 RepID=A0A9X7FFP3_9BIFI|nr:MULTISPECIES: protein phosphatase 2C domain-containing protein [Gardnerella]ADB13641.1 protein phosphatase 2C [Gardnerella vaginalis 409-05]APW18081.1 phosphoprotein phosphatase [Gardnerella vaginalis]EFH71301.1 serine/threonine protein phosphatase [Gardnerella vaginalis 5-1]RFT32788.1 serine/threonine-protein phosphatase [Bifidobacteriaceae bacterium NR020]MDK7093373.1 protein phosphatase 2C domain-containing protein [Gardnerella swidsinskii]